MEVLDLNATPREGTGKSPARRLRSTGFIPAVLYGPKIDENVNVSLNEREMTKLIHKSDGGNLLLKLKIDGIAGEKSVMFKEVVRDPVIGTILHVDLMEVSLDQKVVVSVPIHLFGKCKGVEAGGKIHQEMRDIHLSCLPTEIPQSIDIDMTDVELGVTLHVSDLLLPENVEASDDSALPVVSVAIPSAVKEEEEEAEGEEEAEATEEAAE